MYHSQAFKRFQNIEKYFFDKNAFANSIDPDQNVHE